MTAAILCAAIVASFPDVPPARACAAAEAIVAEADGEDPALIAAIAYGESRFDARSINPRTGACGPMAVLYSHDRRVQARRCRRLLADERAGYREGIRKLRDARAYCARRGTPTALCELAGYISGPAGVRGRWHRRPRAVLARARMIAHIHQITHIHQKESP